MAAQVEAEPRLSSAAQVMAPLAPRRPASVAAAISLGVAKFNVGTVLKKTYLDGLRGAVAGWDGDLDVHAVAGSHRETDVYEAGKAGLRERVRALIRLYGGSGRAGEG